MARYYVGWAFGRGWRERQFNAHGRTTPLCIGEFTAAPLPIANVEAHLAQHVLDALEAQDAPSDYDAHLVGRDQTEQFSFEGQSGAGTVKAVNADGALEMEWTPEGGRPRILTVDRSDALTWDWLWK